MADNQKSASSVHDIAVKNPPFGSRFLTDESDVWTQNAWDHVPPPDDQVELIAASLSKQRLAPVPVAEKPKYNDKPSRHWDNFYKANSSNFFRNRKWLHNEFPELVKATQPEAGPVTIVEVGCGAGNAVFPLLSANKNPELIIRAYDYSTHAIKLVQNDPLYLCPPAGSIQASVWDLTSHEGLPSGLEPGTIDIAILIFVFSALHPDEWGRALANIYSMLKPGGLVVMRDYGRHDLTQLRFKGNRLMEENLYIRGDKTRVYFFEADELALLFTGVAASRDQVTDQTAEEDDEQPSGVGLPMQAVQSSETHEEQSCKEELSGRSITPTPPDLSSPTSVTEPEVNIHPNLLRPFPECPPHPLFTIEQLGVDRRLLVNRKRQLKMYRIWMQGKFRKIC